MQHDEVCSFSTAYKFSELSIKINNRRFLLQVCLQRADLRIRQISMSMLRVSPFSNPHPVEGEEITIWVEVQNIGEGTPTMNEDLVVDLYEGDPATQPLQILCSDVILELKAGRTDRVAARVATAPPGQTEIYAVVNPTGEEHIAETERRKQHHARDNCCRKIHVPCCYTRSDPRNAQERDYLDKNTTRQT